MDVLLINPPTENLVKTFAPESLTEEVGFYPPLGLLYLAAYAKAAHGDRFNIEVLDTQVEHQGYAEIEQVFRKRRPQVVGISCMTFLLIDALNVARVARKVLPEAHIVFGGTHPTIYPMEMAGRPETDSIVFGEGEVAFSELLEALAEKKSLAGIPGVAFRENGRVIVNPGRQFLTDLDALPFPDRELLPYKDYYNLLGTGREIMTSLLTSRGCPFDCVFCTKKDGRTCRMRSPENVVEEIEVCLEKGITDFNIVDDTFTINRKRALAIADMITRKGLRITMDIRARVDQVDREMLEKLAEAGCNRIRYGVESGSAEVLKTLRKGIELSSIKPAFELAKKAGMTTFAYFMVGSPGETKEDIKASIALAKDLDPDYVQFLVTTPFPATDLYDLGREKGILQGDFWRDFSLHPTPDFIAQWWTEHFTPEELDRWQKRAHTKFYYRPKYIFRQIRRLKSFKEFKRKTRAAIKLWTG